MRRPDPMRFLGPPAALGIGLLAGSRGGTYGVTDAALRSVLAPPPSFFAEGPATDGVAVFTDWLPLARAFPGEGAGVAHGVATALFGLLALAAYALGRGLGLGRGAALAGSALFAAHPIGAALHADLAGRGALLATALALVAAALGLRGPASTRRREAARVGGSAAALGLALLAEPIAAVVPAVLALDLLHRRRRDGVPFRALDWKPLAAQIAAIGLWTLVRSALTGESRIDPTVHPAIGPSGDVGVLAGATLAGRALQVSLLGTPLVRFTDDVAWDALSWAEPRALLGAVLLLLLPVAARLVRARAVSVGLAWTWATLLALSQIAGPFASAEAPSLLPFLLVGPALLAGAAVRGPWPTAAVVAGAIALSLGPTATAASWFGTEETLLRHELETVPHSLRARVALASHLVAHGQPRKALDVLGAETGPGVARVRVRALLDLRRWGSARRALADVEGPERAVLACEVAAVTGEIGAVAACEGAVAEAGPNPALVRSLAIALEGQHRPTDAERVLRDALASAPRDPVLLEALASHYRRRGLLREAVAAAEEWYAETGFVPAVRAELVRLLVEKGRGDLFERRDEEAARVFERALSLDPTRHELRYHLADAYAALGREAEARTERDRARAAGAAPPPRPGEVRGLPPPPLGGDHDHDHDHELARPRRHVP